MIFRENQILVLNRKKSDWPGLTFPGGHIEENEDHYSAIIREVKEETGLDIKDLTICGFYEWKNDQIRDLCLIYKTNKFKGDLKSSNEGEVFWVNLKDLNQYQLSTDFDKILNICLK